MATPSTARRSDPHSSRFHADIETPRSPRTIHATSRPSTPRPSISPLSTASKAPKSSPIAQSDLHMLDSEVEATTGDANERDDDNVDAIDPPDDRSSSLSEPEDEPDDDMLQNGIRQDMAAAEELAAQQSLEIDSEAETERLEQTPHRLRKHADSIGRTPSKLSQAATVDDDLSDPPSPLPTGPGAASSTSTATLETAGKKRKRSQSDDSSLTSADSDFAQSPRKRTHDSPDDEETLSPDGPGTEVVESAEAATDGLEAEEEAGASLASTKAGRGRKSKLKSKLKKESPKEPDTDTLDENAPADEDQSEESAGKTEDSKHKHEASTLFEDLSKQFTTFREKVYSERLAALTAELELLKQPNCKHSEYLRQVACVDTRYAKQVGEVQAFYRHKSESLRRSTLGERAQLHGQFYQYTRELRENVLSKLGDDWYNIQKERRQSGQTQDQGHIPKFPSKKSVQIRHQAKYNQEVSILSGIAKYVGFPAAPDILGVPSGQIEDDLKAMKITKRVPQPATHSQVPFLSFGNGKMAQASNQIAQHERLAHEQFIEQNAWARPQGQFQTHGTPNLTHTADWAEPVAHHSAKHLIRTGVHHVSPYSTPIPQRHAPMDHSSAGTIPATSDPLEPPSSVQAAPPTSERLRQSYTTEHTSPLPIPKSRHPANTADLPDSGRNHVRDAAATPAIRNISGASTIDAPPDSSNFTEKDVAAVTAAAHRSLGLGLSGTGPGPDITAPHSVFETSQLPRHGHNAALDPEPSYAHPGFRPRDGAFGTPGPFGTTTPAVVAGSPLAAPLQPQPVAQPVVMASTPAPTATTANGV